MPNIPQLKKEYISIAVFGGIAIIVVVFGMILLPAQQHAALQSRMLSVMFFGQDFPLGPAQPPCLAPFCTPPPIQPPRPSPTISIPPQPTPPPDTPGTGSLGTAGTEQQGQPFPANAKILDMSDQVQILGAYTVTPQQSSAYRGDPVVVDFTAEAHADNTDYIGTTTYNAPITVYPYTHSVVNGTSGTGYVSTHSLGAGNYEVRYYKKFGANTYGVVARSGQVQVMSNYRAQLLTGCCGGGFCTGGPCLPASGQLTITAGQSVSVRFNLPEPRPTGTFFMELRETTTNTTVWREIWRSDVVKNQTRQINDVGTYQFKLLGDYGNLKAASAGVRVEAGAYTITPQQSQVYRGDAIPVTFTAEAQTRGTDYIGIARTPINEPPLGSMYAANGTNGTVYVHTQDRDAGNYEVRYYKRFGASTYGVVARAPVRIVSNYRAQLLTGCCGGGFCTGGPCLPASGQLTITAGQSVSVRFNLPEPRPTGTFTLKQRETTTNVDVWSQDWTGSDVFTDQTRQINDIGTYKFMLYDQSVALKATSANVRVE